MAKPTSNAELRRKVIAEFRGYREPRPLMHRVQDVAALVTKAMVGLGLGERVREAEVLAAWKETVGDFIASHSAPHRLKDGVLYVRVLQPTVHYEMERMRGSITAKLKERFGARTVREVRFRVG